MYQALCQSLGLTYIICHNNAKRKLLLLLHFAYEKTETQGEMLNHLPKFTQLMCVLRGVWLFVTPWTVACQAPLSIGFPRQEYWSRLSCPSPDLNMSSTNWYLPKVFVNNWTATRPFAICLCGDCILCCCSCWPLTWPEGSLGWRVRHSVFLGNWWNRSLLFSSQLASTLCDPVDCSRPDFPVLHCLPEFTQTHVH